jgi:hypothetical protein
LETVANELQKWSSENFGNVTKRIVGLRKEIERPEWNDPVQNRDHILEAKRELEEIFYQEEMLWLQRSCITWLREGDRNTKYFHRKAMWRAKKNRIKRLLRENGSWCTDETEMRGMAASYFESLFLKDDAIVPDEVVDLFEPKITNDMNFELCKPFSEEEISDAMFQIGPLKASGPDGLPDRFFQRNWLTLKEDVITAVNLFFETDHMPEGVNDTCVVLIPKINHPESLKDFRPISLCNVIYKVVSKCIVNRIRPMLQDIILTSQSAFISGRMITDNAIIAFECIHAIKGNSDARGDFVHISWTYPRLMIELTGIF